MTRYEVNVLPKTKRPASLPIAASSLAVYTKNMNSPATLSEVTDFYIVQPTGHAIQISDNPLKSIIAFQSSKTRGILLEQIKPEGII